MQEPHHVTKVSKATQWKPGVSGNPAGKPIGTRHAFSQGFIRISRSSDRKRDGKLSARLRARAPRALSRLLRKSARGCQGKQSSAQIFNYAGIDLPTSSLLRVRTHRLSQKQNYRDGTAKSLVFLTVRAVLAQESVRPPLHRIVARLITWCGVSRDVVAWRGGGGGGGGGGGSEAAGRGKRVWEREGKVEGESGALRAGTTGRTKVRAATDVSAAGRSISEKTTAALAVAPIAAATTKTRAVRRKFGAGAI